MSKEIISTNKAPGAIGPYSQAIRANGMIFSSGQIPINPANNELVEGVEAQTRQVMENIKAILTEADLSFEDVIKCSVFVSDMNDYGKINAVYAEYFNEDTAPARELVEVGNLPKFMNIEISIIAAFD